MKRDYGDHIVPKVDPPDDGPSDFLLILGVIIAVLIALGAVLALANYLVPA